MCQAEQLARQSKLCMVLDWMQQTNWSLNWKDQSLRGTIRAVDTPDHATDVTAATCADIACDAKGKRSLSTSLI
jgi:hypothetical protein